MNEFEKRINALRLQYKAERISINRDANRTIGHLNTAIGQAKFPEVRAALRAKRARVYEAERQSIKYSRLCYLQQLEALEDEYRLNLDRNPSKRQLRRILAVLCEYAESQGLSTLSLCFGDNRHAEVTFNQKSEL